MCGAKITVKFKFLPLKELIPSCSIDKQILCHKNPPQRANSNFKQNYCSNWKLFYNSTAFVGRNCEDENCCQEPKNSFRKTSFRVEKSYWKIMITCPKQHCQSV